ncbi:MAG TPA: methylenetetrahydrofolate--tRNA-(uracil(54)-C(5))-methyltransferase (FADH(2)-oxidizing) TrmFO [Alphaproteobacteria bacterium]|nr:methylenetetrahydrofolate--tRNA-(uracil(54)-C(5))-methyltransferase (FADH(2)-oxidizing) TrmFO [Alphaproteobacteria bacterium]
MVHSIHRAPYNEPLHIIGGGLAGCEAAWQAGRRGLPVILHEMRPNRRTEAHETDRLAEMVCSNSFRSDDHQTSAVGLLHEEMRRAGSLVMQAADANKVPAGSALAVDRDGFSRSVEAALASLPNVQIERNEVAGLPPSDWAQVIIATGPLTSAPLAEAISTLTGIESLAFFDAIAPIVYADSIDLSQAWFQSRYDKPGPGGGGKDYINCPLDAAQYDAFINALLLGEKTQFKDWERNTPYFEGCLPVEVMAERGPQTLRYGPMKPVGLTNPHSPLKPHAVVQLRQDNALGTLYNIVGFQTKLKHAEQVRIFRTIPGLQNAEFARLGGIHRNTFINSPRLLDPWLRLKSMPRLRFAGQITGVEGYVESAAIGLLAGLFAAAEIQGRDMPAPPENTAMGALLRHLTGGASAESFQPMNVNFGLFPPIATPLAADGKRVRGKAKTPARKGAYCQRALEDQQPWLQALPTNAPAP